MSDRIDEVLDRLGSVENALGEQTLAFARLSARLEERCPDNERRIEALEKRPANGALDARKFWVTIAIALAALATAIAAIAGRV